MNTEQNNTAVENTPQPETTETKSSKSETMGDTKATVSETIAETKAMLDKISDDKKADDAKTAILLERNRMQFFSLAMVISIIGILLSPVLVLIEFENDWLLGVRVALLLSCFITVIACGFFTYRSADKIQKLLQNYKSSPLQIKWDKSMLIVAAVALLPIIFSAILLIAMLGNI